MNAEAEGCKLIFLWRLLNAENVDVCSNSKLVHSHTCVAREKLYGDFGFETALILKEKDIKDFKNAVLPRSVCESWDKKFCKVACMSYIIWQRQ